MRKLITVLLSMALALTCCFALGACGNNTDNSKKVAFITAAAGRNDNGYNQSGVIGLEKAEKDLGVKHQVIEEDTDVPGAIEQCAEDGYGLIFSLEYDFNALISGTGGQRPIAERYPNSTFVVFNDTPNIVDGARKFDNVICVTFDVHEASYIAGALAVQMIENQDILQADHYNLTSVANGGRKVGFIGATNSNGITVFGDGYFQGVNQAAKDLSTDSDNIRYTVYDNYSAGFVDAAGGGTLAKNMYDKGANVVFACAGNVGTGVMAKANEVKKFGIEVDADKDATQPGYVLTSVLKNTEVPVYELIKAFSEGKLTEKAGATGVLSYSLATGATGITELTEVAKFIKTDETSQAKWTEIKNYLNTLSGKFGTEIIVSNAQAGDVLDYNTLTHIVKG